MADKNNNWRSKVNAMMTDQDYAAKAASVIGDTRSKNLKLMNKSAEDYPALSVGQQTKLPLGLASVLEMQKKQAARATMGSNDEDYSGVVDLATKLYDEERTKRGQQALQNMQQPANAFASPMATAINRAAETNKAADISKTYEAVISNPSLQQAVRLNANKALVKALEANPSMSQEEQQKLFNNTIDKQLQKMGEGIDKYLRGKNELKGGGEYVLRSAVQNSIIGKAMQTAIQSASGSEGELAYQQQALADYDANKAKWWEQGLGIAGGLVLDAPLMQSIGSAANATFGKATMWGLGKAGGKALQASTIGRIATGAAVSSGTLGGYNATSALANQLMEGRFDVGEIAASAGHGFMLGALTGAMSPWLRGVSAGMGKVGKVATMTGGLATEAGIFTASELSEMENPYDLETIGQVFGKNVAVIGGLKISNLPKTVKEYKQWYTEGKQSNFTDADYKTMADFAKANGYAADDAFTMSADGAYSRSVADRVTGNRTLLTMTKLQGGKEQNLAIEMYNDPNVPLSLKTKIAAKMNLPAPPPVLPNGVRVGSNKAITYYTMPNGQQQVIDIKEFDRPRKARAYANEFSRTTARRNDLLQSEASVNVMMSQPMVIARLNEQAKRNGTTLAEEKARMDGILQRAADGTITQEDIAYYRSIVEDDVTTTESLKKDIKDKYGVEIDEVLNKEGNFTTAEDEALTAYGNALRTIIERGNPTTERTATAAMAGIEDYVALNNLGIEQTSAILSNPEQRAAIEQQTRSHYAAWLKFFDGKMGEDALAQKLGLDLNNTSDLQTFLAEQTYFKTKAADRIAYNTAEAAKQLLERGDGGVRFLDDGRVKLKGVPYAVEVSEDIVARYEAAKQGSGEPLQRIANDALKDIIKQSETPAEPKEPIAEEMPDVEEPMSESEAVTQQMVDARLAEIDTDLQGIEADGVQRMTINGKPVAIIKGRIVADENGQVDKTKSSAEVAYILLDENGRPMLNEQGKPIIEIGVKPSNVHVEDIEQWRSVDDYKASEEQRIRENNRITDEAMRQVDEQTEVENQVPTEPKTADDLLAMCDGDKALALDVATDELAKAMQAKGKGATPAETIEINKRIRMYQQMVDRLSATEQPESAALPEAEQTEVKAEPQVTEDMEFVYQQGLEENHEGMEPMQMTDGRYKWIGLQQGELTANMGERDVELLDNLAKKLGVAVIPINVADRAVNGYYKDGNIYVNTNRGAEWTMRWVAGHEMLHDVAKKSPDAYNAYKQAVLDMWGSDYIESQVKQIIEDYAKSGKTIDREQALTELVNDFGGDLFSSRDGLKILDGILKDQSSKGNVGFIDTIKKWWDNIKEFFGVSPYANEVEKKLADAYKSAMKVMADRMGERKVVEQQELVTIGGLKGEAVVDDAIDNEGAEMSIVRDRNKIDELEGEELVPMYRTFQVLDGRLYPPMATIQAGKKVHSIAEGDWWKSDENPDLALVKIKGTRDKFYSKDDDRISKKDGQWVITIDGEDKPLSMNGKSLSYYFNLKKGEKGDVATDDLEAAYNPYIHTSKSALNDQFRGAYLRPNLVLVEVLVPKSEIDGTNRYKADYAKDGIGFVPWNEGQVIKQAVAAGHPGRDVALSRYAKIGRVFSNTEWADRIDAELAPYKDKITLPFVAFPPEVLRGLANKGYKIEPPTSKKAQPYYEKWLNGEQPTDSNGGGKPTEDSEFSVKRRFGGNSGYVGYSKSVRAVDAEERGLRSVSKMDADFKDRVNAILADNGVDNPLSLAEIKRIAKGMKGDEWHHTSMYGNRTEYYSAESIAEKVIGKQSETTIDPRISAGLERMSYRESLADKMKTDRDIKIEVDLGNGKMHTYTVDAFRSSDGLLFDIGKALREEPIEKQSQINILNTGQVGNRELYLPEWYINDHSKEITKAVAEYNSALAKAKQELDAEFSIKADKELEKKSLVGVHNLTEDNLRYALNLGGLANPSTAVINKDIMGLEGFGDISLIMPKSLVAKSSGKNAGTFAGDAYTPRFPRGSVVKYMTKDGKKAVAKDYPGKDKFSQDFRSAIYSLGDEYGGVTPTLYYMYKLENGGAKIVKAEAPKIKSKEHQRMIDKFGNKEWYELNDAEKRELVDYRKSEMIESLKGADKNMVDKVVNDFINSADPEDLAYKKLRMLKMDYKEQQRAGEIDYMATYRNAQDDVALAGEQDKFNKWLADKSKRYGIEDRIFRGYTSSGNRKYAPMTLANISKVMKEQGRAGAETFMTKSAYSLRGKMLPVYKTLEQIKKNKNKLADTETYEKFRNEIVDEYNELILDISELPNAKYDDTHYILEDALLKGFDYAEKQAGIQISKAVRERISAFGNLLKEAPVKYFETKFERPVMFNEFVAAIVPKDINPELRKALTDNGLAVEEYDRGDEASRLEAIRKASDRDDVQFSVKGKRADESVLDYAKRMSEETGKKNLLNGGSYFSGGGLLEEGLKGIVNPTIAVEFNQKVAGVYRNNFGEHIVTADVRNVDPASLVKNIDGPVAYFHASPVCKNFSKAKQSAEELPLDKATAQSTAEFISKVRPKIVTIENVKGYRDSESMKIILDELKKQGYNYDVDVYNAADYGAYTSRERLIVRAVRDWSLPAKPMVMLADDRPSGWLEAVADIIDTLPEKKGGVAKWMDERLMAMGIDYRNIDKPLYVFGSGYSKDRIGYAFADELVPTLRTKGGDVIIMPDGRVLKATPRVLARISGMSDEYQMPKTDDLAHTIVGNGIPVQLTKAVMGSLIENVKSDLDAGNTEYSIIGKRGAANLDKRDETSIRVDNMVTAEEMEKAGKDAKTIRMATGWERGADGKWRYEVDDLSMLPAEQWIGKRGKKLSDIVENAEELFAAYPELANVKIKEGNGKTYGGSYSDGTITLDTYLAKLWMKRLPDSLPRANKFMNETLIHEIQHYIQEKEGFAQGGNESMILNKDAISEIDALISDSNKLAVQYNDMIAKGVYEGREAIKDKIISLRAEANAIKKKNSLGTEGYRSLAGEVEARNAEFRSNMTDKERANTMLADTEDVAREDQIFLPDDLSKNAKGDYSIKQPKDAEYEAKEQWRKDNAGAIASSFFADRRADKAAEVERLKKKISELKADNTKAVSEDKAKVREIADEMHAYIKKNIPTENQGDMTRQQFESVLKQLETAVTKQELEKPMQMVEYIGANVARRALTRQMRDFVKNGFKALTPKGLAKPKTVDGVTSRVLGLVKTLYQAMNKNAFGSDLYKLQKQVREEKAKLEQFNADNGGKYQDVIDKVNEILAKTGIDRYEELYKYFDEKQAGDVDGEVLGYIGRMLPLLDSIELTKDQQKQAKADSAIVTKEDLDQLRTSLEEKRDKGILSEEDKAVLDFMPLYEAMLSLHQQQLNIDGPGASSLAMQMKAKVGEIKECGKKLDELDNKNSKTAIAYKTRIKEANNELQELFAARIVDQKAVNANVGELLDNLKEIRDTGKSKLQEWSKAKQERATRLVKMANESFGKDAKGYWSEVDKRGKLKKDFINWANNLRLSVLMSPAMSFEYMLGVMDPRYYTNNSPIYKQFIKSSEGLIKANDNFFEGTESYNMAVNEAVERFINRNAMTNLKEYFRRGDRFATAIIPFEVKVNRNGVDEYIPKEEMMTRGQAAKIYAWSRMADGMAKLKAHGVTDNTLTKVKEFIGEDYMNFIDWVEDEFFPRLRRERYNPIYKQMYGISMAENDHYFPFLIYQKDVRTEQELEVSNNDTLGGGVVGNLVERKRNNARLDFTAGSPDIFDMITDYGKKMEEWAAYAQVREDLKKVVNDKQFKQHCDELGTHYYKYFLEAAQVASRLSRDMAMTQHTQSGWAKAQKTIASAAISLRVSTALKQLLSAPAFMVYSLDPAFQHELIKTVQPINVEAAIKGLMKLAEGDMSEAKKLLLDENWVGHYNWCVENLPSFRERVTLKGAGNPILEEKGFFKFADDIQSVGMLPNRLVDAFTCSVGAKAIYEYAYKKYKKNYSEKTAHNMAVTDAEIAFNSSQQSSNPVFLAPMQVSKQFLLRGMMNYKNSPIGYYRNAMKASIDMYRATKAIFGQPKFTINGEVYGFESDGKNPYAMAAESGARASMFWLFLNLIWNFGTVGVAGLSYTMLNGSKNDDGNMLYTDEEIKKALGNDMGWALFNASNQGIPWVSGFSSAAQTGQDYTPSILFSEMNNYVEQINKDGFMSMATAQIFTDLLLKNAAGVDPEVWGQIYRGAQGIMEDRPMRIEDFMNLIASPRSAISGVTKQRVGEYDRLRDYVNDRIASNRQLGVDERMTFGKKLTGMRELSKKSLGIYVDEYLADKIPGYREFTNKPTEMEKEEDIANSNTLNAASSLYETIVRKEEEKEEKKDKIKDRSTKRKIKVLTKVANVIHKLCEVNDFETAERVANEMERRVKRGYNPDGETIEERLKNVDVWDSTGTTEQRSADRFSTAFDRARKGGFDSYLRRGKD